MKRNNIICLDFETGGFKCDKNAVTQVAVQSFEIDTFKEISRYSSYVAPYNDLTYEDKALEMTGITMKMISEGEDIKVVVKDLIEQFKLANTAKTHTKKPTLLGHNIMFDIAFLQYIFKYCKEDLSKYIECKEDAYGKQVPLFFDTMLMSRLKWGVDEDMTSFNLSACCQKAGIDIFDAHDAQNDVTATRELFIYFTNHLRTGSGTSEESNKARFRETFEI